MFCFFALYDGRLHLILANIFELMGHQGGNQLN